MSVTDEARIRFSATYRAQRLVDWLNKHPKSPEAKRLVSILADLRYVWRAAGDGLLREEWVKRAASLEAQLSRYRLKPEITFIELGPSGAKRTSGQPIARGIQYSLVDQHGSTAIGTVLQLIGVGYAWLIGRCECGKWFLAKVRWQDSCGKDCRLKGPSWKAHRAQYLRWYRAKESGKTKLSFEEWKVFEAEQKRERGKRQ